MTDMTGALLPELGRLFAETLARVPDDAFDDPSLLPGWTRAHVVAHVHFNAVALCRLVGWARTGVESAMYASPAQRAEEIERGAAEAPAVLRREVSESAVQFSTEFGQLTEDERERIVVTAQGRHVPARELVWIRCRELGVHAVDLDAGTTFDDLPGTFVDGLVHEIVDKRLKSGEGANLAALLSGRTDGRPLERWL